MMSFTVTITTYSIAGTHTYVRRFMSVRSGIGPLKLLFAK